MVFVVGVVVVECPRCVCEGTGVVALRVLVAASRNGNNVAAAMEHPKHKGGGHGYASLDFPQQHLQNSLASRPGYVASQAIRNKHALSSNRFCPRRTPRHNRSHIPRNLYHVPLTCTVLGLSFLLPLPSSSALLLLVLVLLPLYLPLSLRLLVFVARPGSRRCRRGSGGGRREGWGGRGRAKEEGQEGLSIGAA